jgi:hypothetical protein
MQASVFRVGRELSSSDVGAEPIGAATDCSLTQLACLQTGRSAADAADQDTWANLFFRVLTTSCKLSTMMQSTRPSGLLHSWDAACRLRIFS